MAMDVQRGGVAAVGGRSKVLTYTPVINTVAYTANDAVGTDTELAAFFRIPSGTALLQSLLVIDKGDEKAALEVYLFSADPAGTFTNNGAFPTLTSADALLIVARISVAAADYVTQGGVAVAHLIGLGRVLEAATDSKSLWVAIATTGTPTYAVGDLVLRFGILHD